MLFAVLTVLAHLVPHTGPCLRPAPRYAQGRGVLLGDDSFLATPRHSTRRLGADPETGWGFGYQGGALPFAAGLALVIAAYYWTRISHTILLWAAFILTRPLGATVGDFFDKPVANGGLALSRYSASAALIACMFVLIFAFRSVPSAANAAAVTRSVSVRFAGMPFFQREVAVLAGAGLARRSASLRLP